MAYFEITERILDKSANMIFLHNHTFFEMYFLISGEKNYFTEKSYYQIPTGSVTITKPNSFHKFEGGPFHRMLIAFDSEILSEFQSNYLCALSDESPVITFEKDDFANLNSKLKQLSNYYVKSGNKNFENLSIELSYIVWFIFTYGIPVERYKNKIIEITPYDKLSNLPSTIYRLIQFIDDNYDKTLNIDEFRKDHCYSMPWLYKHFKETTGMTMIEYKHKVMIEKAKCLLTDTNSSISKVGKMTGFSTTSYFIKIFTKFTGTTPLKYRIKVQKRK